VGLERGPLSLASTTGELLGKEKSSGSGLENRNYDLGDPQGCLRDTPLSAKVGTNFADKRQWLGRIVRFWTEITEFSLRTLHVKVTELTNLSCSF
jgi:hypothetical protein